MAYHEREGVMGLREMSPVPLLRAPNLSRLDVVHGFTTRQGGVSEGPRATLNLALRGDETQEAVVENWRRALGSLPGEGEAEFHLEDLALLDQVHGADVVRVEAGRGPLAVVASADAAYTTRPGLVLTVRVADCVPVLLAGPGCVGVAHAGWRGTALRVVPRLVGAIKDDLGIGPEKMTAAVGPCISGPAYEVGDEVVEALKAAGLSREVFLTHREASGRPHVDLARAVVAELREVGVSDVHVLERCTASETDFFSHRRDGPHCGRNAALIARPR
jgi:YfiH family protein